MTKVKSKSRKQLYNLWVMNRKQLRSLDLIFLNFLIFSDCFVKLLNLLRSEMQNEKNKLYKFFSSHAESI